ncbi:MAG: hypothetical protein IPJ65_28665 [Archangiaceae bacterium]|nr:hypothetical protein [Archangiaceae bacterium]
MNTRFPKTREGLARGVMPDHILSVQLHAAFDGTGELKKPAVHAKNLAKAVALDAAELVATPVLAAIGFVKDVFE